MRTRVEFVDESGDGGRIGEVGELFRALREHGDIDFPTALAFVPRWLGDAFAPERTLVEAEVWLEQWRAAPDKLAFERESGWTAENWLHWFSPENEFWQLGEVSVEDGGRSIVIYLDHSDDPVPVEALRWLAIVGKFRVKSILRVQ